MFLIFVILSVLVLISLVLLVLSAFSELIRRKKTPLFPLRKPECKKTNTHKRLVNNED